MLRNFIILAISATVIIFNVIAFRTKNGDKRKLLVFFGILIALPWAGMIFIPNFPWLLSPLTPKARGTVIDEETKKPLPNTHVRIAWVRHEATVGGGGRPAYKVYNTTTNEKGEFIIPRTSKSLSVYVPSFFISKYGGMDIFVYNLDYEAGRFIAEAKVPEKDIEISMQLIKDEATYLKNLSKAWEIFFSYRIGRTITSNEKDYLVSAYRHFEKKYPQSDAGEDNLFQLSSLLERTGDIQGSIDVLLEMIRIYPHGKHAAFGRYHSSLLQKSVGSK